MELTVHIPFSDLLQMLKQLSPAQRTEVQKELSLLPEPSAVPSKAKLRNLLLNGPVLTDDELNRIEQTRKEINRWRNES